MGKELFQIILDNQNGVFYPGQSVSGRVELQLKDDLKVTAIYITFKGYANVHWTERHGSGKNRRTRHYSSNEHYFSHKVCLLGKDLTGESTTKLNDDKLFTFPFNFQLPPGSPSSYEATIGRVRYFLQSDIDIPWAFDKHTKRMITVVNLLDLNTVPNVMNGASKTDQKTLCCLCCESEPIIASVMVDRTGYVPGEAIVFRSEIENKSDREMTCSKAKLVMEVRYHATSKTRSVKNIVNEMSHGKIEGGGTDVWMNEKLHIPAVPPSYLQGCKIIDIRYYLMITVDPSGLGFDLDVPVEVVIGSIPLASIAQQHGMTLPPPPPPSDPALPPPPPGAPQGLYNDATMPTYIPQATLAESALGRVSTREEGDTDDTAGDSNFAPVYTYYNWNKPDPNTTFTVKMDEGDVEEEPDGKGIKLKTADPEGAKPLRHLSPLDNTSFYMYIVTVILRYVAKICIECKAGNCWTDIGRHLIELLPRTHEQFERRHPQRGAFVVKGVEYHSGHLQPDSRNYDDYKNIFCQLLA